jgi:SAM-dependent methyltransferase
VLDLGCGFGTSLLSLGRLGGLSPAAGLSPLREQCNLLGCDGSSLKTAFATGTSQRWELSGHVQFARASAEVTLAHASCSSLHRLAGVIVQFPTPFRIDGGGNSQLPRLDLGEARPPSANQYMLPRSLLEDIAHALRDSAGWFFFQANVEDVACVARAMAEDAGLRLVATDEAAMQAIAFDRPSHAPTIAGAGDWRGRAGEAGAPGSLRQSRLQGAGIVSPMAAVGPGWLSRNPLGVLTETEAALELDGRRIHRFLAVARQ